MYSFCFPTNIGPVLVNICDVPGNDPYFGVIHGYYHNVDLAILMVGLDANTGIRVMESAVCQWATLVR